MRVLAAQALGLLQAETIAVPPKRLSRLAVLLSRAALGLPPKPHAATSRQPVGGAASAVDQPYARPIPVDTEPAAGNVDSPQPDVSTILRGLAQLTVHGDIRAEQALAEALRAETFAGDAG